jgi:hypothetical protein
MGNSMDESRQKKEGRHVSPLYNDKAINLEVTL